ncbi:hypothetical protein BDZ97DRAFT_1668574, partial [Flammula alnicola]
SASLAYNGISITTNRIANEEDLNVICTWVLKLIPETDTLMVWVGLPTSKSFLKVMINIPAYKNIAQREMTTRQEVQDVLCASPLSLYIVLEGLPRVVWNSKASPTTVAQFNIWDSQAGTHAKALIRRSIMFRGKAVLIVASAANHDTPLCTHCWRWGHPKQGCHALRPRCARCSGPHEEEVHCISSLCCQADPNATPLHLAMPLGTDCPQTACCPSCRGEHKAYEKTCLFWHHCFN